jgi:hypothetical protein
MIVSTILGASSQASQGIAANQAAQYNAAQSVAAGKAAVGAATRKAYNEQRQGNLVRSRAQAVAAASGGGSLDPSVIDATGRIQAQTDYNAMSALYEGQTAQQGYNNQAALDRAEGKNAQNAGLLKAGGTLLAGGSSIFDRFGGGGFASYNASNGNWTPGSGGFNPNDF